MSFDFHAYRLAELARQKLIREASRADHNLRCLVLHANLLDNLLMELNGEKQDLRDAERERGRGRERGREISPAVVLQHARLHGTREPVVIVREAGEDAESDDEDEDSEGSPPMLSHEGESDEDSGEDLDSEDEHGEVFSALPASRTGGTKGENTSLTQAKVEDGLELHRTLSGWRLHPRNY